MRNGENILQQLDSMSADEIYEYACTYGSTHEAADVSLLAELFVIAAGKGSEKAAWSAGRCYETGQGVAKDLSKAIEYYEQSYAAGYGQAAGSLGNLYFLGNGVEKDLEKAFALYLEGASKGSMQACCNAGMCLFYGYGTAVNENEGIRFLTHAAENGFEPATQLLNEIYGKEDEPDEKFLDGMSIEELVEQAEKYSDETPGEVNMELSSKFYEMAARKGDAFSMFCIGYNCLQGRGVQQDYGKAREWFAKCMEGGHHAGYKGMADLYFYGTGVEQDYAKAYEIYFQAAEKGSLDAQYQIGICLENGYGTEIDLQRARGFFNHCDEYGHPQAAEARARVDRKIANPDGWEDEVDDGFDYEQYSEQSYQVDEETLRSVMEGAEKGDMYSQMTLAGFYQSGIGVETDNDQAIHWYKMAAENGSSDSAYMLGNFYFYGSGVEVDREQAKRYYRKAAEMGNEAAQMILQELR